MKKYSIFPQIQCNNKNECIKKYLLPKNTSCKTNNLSAFVRQKQLPFQRKKIMIITEVV